jgi:cytoskeleton protein RodZ
VRIDSSDLPGNIDSCEESSGLKHMTEIDENESDITEDETAGSQLKAAREAANMTIEQAAERLHLLRETVIALEEKDTSKLPSRVFTLGYLKNYARILDLPESHFEGLFNEELYENVDIRSLQQPRAPELRIRRHQPVAAGHLFVKLITALVVIALIALPLLWWKGVIELPDLSSVPFLPTTEKQGSDETSGDGGSETLSLSIGDEPVAQTESLQNETTEADDRLKESDDDNVLELSLGTEADDTTTEDDITTQAENDNDISTDTAEASAETSAQTSVESSMSSQTTGMTSVSDDVVATDSSTETQSGSEHKVTLDFSDNCWVNVNDAEGKIVLFGDIPAGSSKTLEGKAPFTFVLGNAEKVKVSIDGRAYDIAPHMKGGVARFSLGEPVE